jgi:signal transduction histidine kinase
MTFEQLGVLANLLGLLIPLVFSLFIARAYAQRYFQYWTLSFLFFTISVFLFMGPETFGTHKAWEVAQVVVYVAADWLLLKTAATIGTPSRLARFYTPAACVVAAIASALALAGMPFTVVSIGPILLALAAHYLLAWSLLRLPDRRDRHAPLWLAGLIVVSGSWPLAYPLLPEAFVPLGFVISGALHLSVGIQMVIFLLEDAAVALQTQNEELLELDRLKSDFISTVSHELRTPLSSIKSATWLLQNHRTAVNEAELIGIIANQSDVLHRLVADVLDFAKLEAGSLTYHLQPVRLDHLVKAAVHDATPRFEVKDIALTFVPPAEAVTVTADPDRLVQVISNLLSNALKFTAPGGQVTVAVTTLQGEARLAVSDSGIGIAPEHHARIFERFYQVDNTSTRQVGGAGLGLAISKAIVAEGHQGRIWVEAAPGAGSTFFVALPLAPTPAEPTRPLESHPPRE